MNSPSPLDLMKQAETAYKQGHYDRAGQLFGQASAGYTAAGDALNAAEMASNQSVALLQGGDAHEALQAVQGIDRVFALAGDTRRQAMALGNEAAALDALHQDQLAFKKYQECAELLKQLGDNETRALVMKNISQIQMRTGHQLEALASMEAALTTKKRLNLTERMLKKLLKVPFQMLGRRE